MKKLLIIVGIVLVVWGGGTMPLQGLEIGHLLAVIGGMALFCVGYSSK